MTKEQALNIINFHYFGKFEVIAITEVPNETIIEYKQIRYYGCDRFVMRIDNDGRFTNNYVGGIYK